MEEKNSKISSLETQITIYSLIGWGFVIMALFPIGNVAIDVFFKNKPWPEADLGSFLGGVSGAFAALAGVFFVFVAFLGQRISIIQQQIEIQNNIKELQDTREEIKGQKEQFQIQSYEATFFNLLTHFRNSGPLDRLSIIYTTLKRNFEGLTLDGKQDDTGQWITFIKKNALEILESKSSFTNVIMNIEGRDAEDIYDSINMLLSILYHISNHGNIKINHKSTLKNNISQKEKFVLFYFYLTVSENFSENEQKLLYDFFNELDRLAFFHDSHKSWVTDLPQ